MITITSILIRIFRRRRQRQDPTILWVGFDQPLVFKGTTPPTYKQLPKRLDPTSLSLYGVGLRDGRDAVV